MTNKFYPSHIKNEIYDLMEEYEADSFNDTFSSDFIEALTNYFDDKRIEANIEIEECGNMVDRCCFAAWIEDGHLQSMSFYIED